MTVKYKVHPCVACEQAGGRYFLVSFGPALGDLPYLREVNETGAFYWKLAEEGLDAPAMAQRASLVYDAPEETLKAGLAAFFEELEKAGYASRETAGK